MSNAKTRGLSWPLECPECGTGKIVPTARPGRTAHFGSVKGLPVPEDFEIPTCGQCGSEWIDAAAAEAMDEVMERVCREQLQKSVAMDLQRLTEYVTQRRLEEFLGLSQGYLSKVRSGVSQPSQVLARCLRLLATDPERRLEEMAEPLMAS
jgi:hypothetical protein